MSFRNWYVLSNTSGLYSPDRSSKRGSRATFGANRENIKELFSLLSLRKSLLAPPHLLTDGNNLTQKWHPDLGWHFQRPMEKLNRSRELQSCQRPPTCHPRKQTPTQGPSYPPTPGAGLAPHLCLSATHAFWTGGLELCFLVLFPVTNCLYVLVPTWLCNSNSSSNDMWDVPVKGRWGWEGTATQLSICHCCKGATPSSFFIGNWSISPHKLLLIECALGHLCWVNNYTLNKYYVGEMQYFF